MKKLFAFPLRRAIAIAALSTLAATAFGDSRDMKDMKDAVRFEGGIGSQPFRTGATPDVPAPNLVFGVLPGGVPWVIADLEAAVKGGRIWVEGRGLVLAGTDAIGTAGGVTEVRARLFCNGVASDSDLVPLDKDGDFRIYSMLVPTPASPCVYPRLLILTAGGSWIAAGIPDNNKDKDKDNDKGKFR